MVEDTRVPHPEGGPDDLHWVRRMVFLSARGLTQSEAYLSYRQLEVTDKQVLSCACLLVGMLANCVAQVHQTPCVLMHAGGVIPCIALNLIY